MNKRILYSLTFIFFLPVVIAMGYYHQNLEKYGKYSLFPKLDNDTIFLLSDEVNGNTYTCKTARKLDLKTLKEHGEFLTDTHGVYHKYDIDGETLILDLEADLNSFQTFRNSIYAKDKLHIYDSRNGVITNADVNTFEAINIEVDGRVVLGKDKHNYYFWREIVTDTTGFGEIIRHKNK